MFLFVSTAMLHPLKTLNALAVFLTLESYHAFPHSFPQRPLVSSVSGTTFETLDPSHYDSRGCHFVSHIAVCEKLVLCIIVLTGPSVLGISPIKGDFVTVFEVALHRSCL